MIRNWLRAWLGVGNDEIRVTDLVKCTEELVEITRNLDKNTAGHLARIESELAAQEKAHNDAINELREQLGKPRSRSSMRPFHVQARMAEIGAIAQRVKDAG